MVLVLRIDTKVVEAVAGDTESVDLYVIRRGWMRGAMEPHPVQSTLTSQHLSILHTNILILHRPRSIAVARLGAGPTVGQQYGSIIRTQWILKILIS
jgi:hypothetical protein